MIALTEWLSSTSLDCKPWLLLGHGPTLSKLGTVDRNQFVTFGVDHVVRRFEVDVALVTDIDVLDACGEKLSHNARYVLMPSVPNIDGNRGLVPLDYLVRRIPLLTHLERAGRLVSFEQRDVLPTESNPKDAADASCLTAFGVLQRLGARRLFTLGMDAGHGLCEEFRHIERLAAGISSQNVNHAFSPDQWNWGRRLHLEVRPLWDPIHVFIDVAGTPKPVYQLLQHLLVTRSKEPLTIRTFDSYRDEIANSITRPALGIPPTWRKIPMLCDYRGRAICLRGDTLVLCDPAELRSMPPTEGAAIRINRPRRLITTARSNRTESQEYPTSIAVFDCAADQVGVQQTMDEVGFGPDWDGADTFSPEFTKLVYFATSSIRPWQSDAHPLRELWETAFQSAVVSGAIKAKDVLASMTSRRLKPSLAAFFQGDDPYERRIRAVSGKFLFFDQWNLARQLKRLRRFAERGMRNPGGAVRRLCRGHW